MTLTKAPVRAAPAVLQSRNRAAQRRRGHATAVAWQVLGVAVFLGAWELIARQVDYVAIFPPIGVIIEDFRSSLFDDAGLRFLGVRQPGYLVNIAYTLGISMSGWALGSLIGAVVGLLSARLQFVRNVTEPVLFVFGAVPVLVLAPFFLVWFGTGSGNKFVLIAFYAFVTVALVAQSAGLALPRANEEYAATMGLERWARFRFVLAPASLPAILSGLRLALSTSIAVAATVELLGSEIGAGRLIALRAAQGNIASVLAISLALGVAAIILDFMLRITIRGVLRWQ